MSEFQYENDIHTMSVTRSLAMSAASEGALICIRGDNIGTMVTLPSDKDIYVGRDATRCQYILTNSKISRIHCCFTYVGTINQYRVIDQSTNGTFLENGERLISGREYYLLPSTKLYIGNENNLFQLR
ncbi:MAG: FHA domain-containing protein [Clostridiales bacterium]|nr:FHA domain-containing protein [Eubacterium sp.]MDD7350215.1 FHA domain-containing protein [Clostridiales bacterium]